MVSPGSYTWIPRAARGDLAFKFSSVSVTTILGPIPRCVLGGCPHATTQSSNITSCPAVEFSLTPVHPAESLQAHRLRAHPTGVPPPRCQIEELQRASREERAQSFHALSGQTLCPALHLLTIQEVLWTPCFWVSLEASLHRHGWWNHWPLMIELILQPCHPWRSGTKRSNPPISRLVPLQPAPSSGAFQSHLLTCTTPVWLSLQEVLRVLELCVGNGEKDQLCINKPQYHSDLSHSLLKSP